MPISDFFRDGKIAKEKVSYVLKLVDINLNSLVGCYLERYVCLEKKKEVFSFNRIGLYDYDTLMRISSVGDKLANEYEAIFKQNAKDLFEFFYDEKVKDGKGYYSFQFPIDIKKFQKMRVSKEKVEIALKDLEKNGEQFCDYMEKNYKIFQKLLKTR